MSQVVGGLATQKLGTKRVFGYAQLVTALCSLSIPWASDTHYGVVIALRFAQGFASVSDKCQGQLGSDKSCYKACFMSFDNFYL